MNVCTYFPTAIKGSNGENNKYLLLNYYISTENMEVILSTARNGAAVLSGY